MEALAGIKTVRAIVLGWWCPCNLGKSGVIECRWVWDNREMIFYILSAGSAWKLTVCS